MVALVPGIHRRQVVAVRFHRAKKFRRGRRKKWLHAKLKKQFLRQDQLITEIRDVSKRHNGTRGKLYFKLALKQTRMRLFKSILARI